MTDASRQRQLSLWRRIAGELRGYRLPIAGVIAINLCMAPLGLLAPLPLKIAVDSVIGAAPLPPWLGEVAPHALAESRSGKLFLAGAIVVGVALATYLLALAAWILQADTGERITLQFRARIFHRLQRLSLGHHDRRGTMDALYRIERDAPSLQSIAVNGVVPVAAGVVGLAAMVYVTAHIDLTLAAVALAIIPALYALITLWRRRLRAGWAAYKSSESAALSVVQEVLGALRLVKAYGREKRERERLIARSRPLVSGQKKVAVIEGGFDLLVGLTLALGTSAILVIGVEHVLAGALSLGDLLLVMGYLAQLYRPLETISRKTAEMQAALASAERAFAVLDLPPDVGDAPEARVLDRASGAIRFDRVSFRYDDGERVLREASFSIPAGVSIGIVGTTGSGKTTLLSLLMRFYDPQEGRILLDGRDIREYRVDDLRRQFAVVLQEPVLFSTTIAENIAYGRPDAPIAEIEAAARDAGAHDFIQKLANGYATEVGERGMLLSGGQRQRVALARAFLRDAPILLLDEPTSAVDVATEAIIMDALERLKRGRTTLMIAHRLTTLRNCDFVLELERDRILRRKTSEPAAVLEAGGLS